MTGDCSRFGLEYSRVTPMGEMISYWRIQNKKLRPNSQVVKDSRDVEHIGNHQDSRTYYHQQG